MLAPAPCLALLTVLLLPACGASDEGTLLAITVTGVTPEVQNLRLTATVSAHSARLQRPASETYVGMQVPPGLGGHLHLEVEGLQQDACFQSSGSADTVLDGQARVDLTVTLRGLLARKCPVQVELQGPGQVTSVPAFIECGQRCAADVSAGSSLTFVAAPSGESTTASLSGSCQGEGGPTSSCTLVVSGPVAMVAQFQ